MNIPECPICMEQLTVPVYQCVHGHSICDGCSYKIEECPICRVQFQRQRRNETLELVILANQEKCHHLGCDATVNKTEIEEHTANCLYRQTACPLEICTWNGPANELSPHFQSCHLNNFMARPGNIVNIENVNFKTDNSYIYLTMHDNLLFILTIKVDVKQKLCYWITQKIGSVKSASEYSYAIHLNSLVEQKMKTELADNCFDDSKKIEDIMNTGKCAIMLFDSLSNFYRDVGSCLINFIKSNLKDGVEDLVLWSDCCGGQNRNIKIALMLKCILNSHPTLKTITFKYLETGHSFLPNDTDFSKIECALKHHERIYTVEEYMKIMKISKKKNPLQVTRMKTQDFLSTTKMEKKIVNRKICTNKRKVNWLKTKQIVLKKEDQYKITMRSESGDIQTLDLSKRQKGVFIKFSEEDFEVLWPQGKPIPQAKLDDLRSMYGLIPEDCHGFYNNLKGNSTIDEDVDGYGPTLDFDLEDDETV